MRARSICQGHLIFIHMHLTRISLFVFYARCFTHIYSRALFHARCRYTVATEEEDKEQCAFGGVQVG